MVASDQPAVVWRRRQASEYAGKPEAYAVSSAIEMRGAETTAASAIAPHRNVERTVRARAILLPAFPMVTGFILPPNIKVGSPAIAGPPSLPVPTFSLNHGKTVQPAMQIRPKYLLEATST
jgi:hypothetical protein